MTIETHQSGNGKPERSGTKTPAWVFAAVRRPSAMRQAEAGGAPEQGQEMKEQGVKTLLFR
jgi:hypothetical protein